MTLDCYSSTSKLTTDNVPHGVKFYAEKKTNTIEIISFTSKIQTTHEGKNSNEISKNNTN